LEIIVSQEHSFKKLKYEEAFEIQFSAFYSKYNENARIMSCFFFGPEKRVRNSVKLLKTIVLSLKFYVKYLLLVGRKCYRIFLLALFS